MCFLGFTHTLRTIYRLWAPSSLSLEPNSDKVRNKTFSSVWTFLLDSVWAVRPHISKAAHEGVAHTHTGEGNSCSIKNCFTVYKYMNWMFLSGCKNLIYPPLQSCIQSITSVILVHVFYSDEHMKLWAGLNPLNQSPGLRLNTLNVSWARPLFHSNCCQSHCYWVSLASRAASS